MFNRSAQSRLSIYKIFLSRISLPDLFKYFQVGKTNLWQQLTASILLVALFLPNVLLGQVQSPKISPLLANPKVEMSPLLLAPPQPFTIGSQPSAINKSPLFSMFSIWETFSSLISFGENSSDSFENSVTPENSVNLLPPSIGDLSRARLSPKNQTGGTSLYSRNFGWGTGLAGLSGRGLDAGFGISYNSLIWAKVGSEMVFNPNNDNVTPGFRFGFPVVEPNYTDPLTGKNTYLMVTPSGGRVEFRQVDGTSDIFETAISSYTQLKVLDGNNLVIIGTDGTHAFYQLKAGAFRCSSIKDANGNYITINHDNNGLLQSVTDTLSRVINVSYDGQGSPLTVTQTRSTGTFTFAAFAYTNITVNTNFSGLTLANFTNGSTVKVLQKITYADGSFTQFDYNNYGQVWKVSNYAADTHLLNYSLVNLSSVSGGQTDCPRFSELRNWAENFNLNGGGVAQEVVIPIVYQEGAGFTVPGVGSFTGTLLQVTAPDGVISKTFVGSSGWMEAIPVLSENWAGGVKQRWNWTNYTQDNPSLSYILNPRVTETKVGDATNVSRTTIDYYTQGGNPQASLYGLVSEVKVYDTNQTSVLKRSTTEYNLNSNYTNRRIIGLPQKSELYDHSNALMSKVTYNYDEGDFSGTGQTISAINHDVTNYGAGFIVGRGNLTSAYKWDVTDPTNGSKAIASTRIKYNITGNPVSSMDPLNREIKTSYTDNFDDSINRNSFAYPTQVTDPANNSSTVKYKFDYGANVFAQSPAPAGQSIGKQTQRIYDALGRLEKEIVVNTGAYTRYEYPTNGVQAKVYSTITDVNSNGADAADEVLSESFTDGAGRTRMTRTEHPGSTGGWSATLTEYDIMGRVKRSTVPTEVNGSWVPNGDDAAKGWTWNALEYDWKGRVTRQINVDSTDKLFSYEGCGCAGGQITTISGEQLTEGRRRQKIYEDILGRTYKTETLNWNGTVYSTNKVFFNGLDQVMTSRQYSGNDSSTTYQDTVMTYDGYGRLKTQHRPEQNTGTYTTYNYYLDDRIQQVVDARGATTNYTYNNLGLVTQVSYGQPTNQNLKPWIAKFGRNPSNHYELWIEGENFSNNVEVILDKWEGYQTRQIADSIPNNQITRTVNGNRTTLRFLITAGTKAYFDANHLIVKVANLNPYRESAESRQISQINANEWNGINSSPETIPVTPTVTYTYDNVGNRTGMTDGFGNVSYEYSQLSQLTAETRQFNATMPQAPLSNNRFKFQYSYSLSGQLKSMTEPFGSVMNYNHDKVGRLAAVTGNAPNNTYISNAQYRAWNALKSVTYGNGTQRTQNYNNNLQVSSYQLASGGTSVMNKGYNYYADGSLQYLQDYVDPRFDRLNTYDHLGRIVQAKSGAEARGQTVNIAQESTQLPYRQSYTFNAFGNMTQRNNRHWGVVGIGYQTFNTIYNIQNNRIVSAVNPHNSQTVTTDWQYDADGRNTKTDYPETQNTLTEFPKRLTETDYDAAGRMIRTLETEHSDSWLSYDGDGNRLRRSDRYCRQMFDYDNDGNGGDDPEEPCNYWDGEFQVYYLRSSVMGEVIAEAHHLGGKNKVEVPLGEGTLVDVNLGYYKQTDALGFSKRATRIASPTINFTGSELYSEEKDAVGTNVGMSSPYLGVESPYGDPLAPTFLTPLLDDLSTSYINGQRATCELDGVAVSCQRLLATSGSSFAQCPNNNCGPRTVLSKRTGEAVGLTSSFIAHADGRSGFYRYTWGQMTVINDDGSIDARNSGKKGITGKYWVEASDEVQISWKEIRLVFRELEKILTPKCRSVIKRVFDKAAELTKGTVDEDKAFSYDPLNIIGNIIFQKGIVTQLTYDGGITVNTAKGAVGAGDAKLIVSRLLLKDSKMEATAAAVLAESFHVAGYKPSYYVGGTFSDYNLAKAIHDLNLGLTPEYFESLKPENMPESIKSKFLYFYPGDKNIDPYQDAKAGNFLWSQYFHSSIAQHCSPGLK